jgi:hypothetical protein
MTLTAFLLARIAEDERAHRADLAESEYAEIGPNVTLAEWSRRGLVECEVKRRIVELYQREADVTARTPAHGPKTPQEARSGAFGESCLLLALPYADHPDYRPEWRP